MGRKNSLDALLLTTALAGFMLSAAPASAQDISGTTWQRDSGASRVKFDRCGDAICGSLVWLKPGVETPAKIGQKIFFDMKPSGANAWSGNAFNPEDGKTYTGKMTLSGPLLTTEGCIMGGLICKSAVWSRVP